MVPNRLNMSDGKLFGNIFPGSLGGTDELKSTFLGSISVVRMWVGQTGHGQKDAPSDGLSGQREVRLKIEPSRKWGERDRSGNYGDWRERGIEQTIQRPFNQVFTCSVCLPTSFPSFLDREGSPDHIQLFVIHTPTAQDFQPSADHLHTRLESLCRIRPHCHGRWCPQRLERRVMKLGRPVPGLFSMCPVPA